MRKKKKRLRLPSNFPLKKIMVYFNFYEMIFFRKETDVLCFIVFYL